MSVFETRTTTSVTSAALSRVDIDGILFQLISLNDGVNVGKERPAEEWHEFVKELNGRDFFSHLDQ